ncbi:reverse transcriptase domain-containing protein [Tanacetum coccineum]
MTVVLNDNNELIPSRKVTGWRVCIDYCKPNDTIRKDHFPLLFIYQMLEHLCGNGYYCFLDGFLGFFQTPIAPEDQEKTTFTCPYGTFAYRRMSFGLCNAHATFQRCMTAIFHDMVEDFMEVFMDDFWVFGHKISRAGIEVDRAKINVIAKLPYPTNVKGVRSFLGHAGFYRREAALKSKRVVHADVRRATPAWTIQIKIDTFHTSTTQKLSPVNRPFSRNTAHKSNKYAVKGKMGTAVKTSAGCVWRKVIPLSNTNSGPTPDSNVNVSRGPQGRPKPMKAWVTRINWRILKNSIGDLLPLEVA